MNKAGLLKAVRDAMALDLSCQACGGRPCDPVSHLFPAWDEAPVDETPDQYENEDDDNPIGRGALPPPTDDLAALNATTANAEGFVNLQENRFLEHVTPNTYPSVDVQNVLQNLQFASGSQSDTHTDNLAFTGQAGTSSGLPTNPILQVNGVRVGNLDITEPRDSLDLESDVDILDEDFLDRMDAVSYTHLRAHET